MGSRPSILQRVNPASRSRALAFAATLMLAALASFAPPARAADDDLPGRVGRIADAGGVVYLAPEDRASEWAEVGVNYPVTGGDNLWISGEGRAEIDFGGGRFRLAGDSNVHVSRLDDHDFSLFVAQGRAIVRVAHLDPGDTARVDTPNTQIALTRPGLYRIDVSPDRQETTLVVREGEATATVTGGVQQVLPGQTATLFGDQDVQADVRNGTGLDGFDAWSADRDRYYRASRSASYVSPQMVGAADLESHGSWQTYADYGAVWFPTSVAVGWAPYRYGRWVSLPAWGLTWVDDAPWGYAPFHYGRWVNVSGRWGWCPGRYVARPVWAPALVAWYGGSSFAVGTYGPVYGWVPLGWRDPYVPGWRCSNRCWTNYNRPYAVNVAERPRQAPTYYQNYQVPGAITAMSGAAFVSGKPVGPNRVSIPSAQLAGAPVLAAAPQVKPLPVATTVLRPGNGAPIPASTAYGVTKPMRVSPQQPATAAPGAPAQPWGKPGPVYNRAEPAPRPAYAPAQPSRAAPVQSAAEPPRGSAVNSAPPGSAPSYAKPQTVNPVPPPRTPSASPGAPAGVGVPPGASYAAPPGNAQRTRAPEPVVNRAEAPRPAPRGAAPPPQPAMNAAPPAPMRSMPAPAPQGMPAPQPAPTMQRAAPPPPPQAQPAPRGVDKPVAGKPATPANLN